MQLSAHAVATLLANIFGPSFYDTPRFGRGDLGHLQHEYLAGPHPEPWRLSELNPQPLPPKAAYAVRLADAHIHELLALDRMALLSVGEAGQRASNRALLIAAELDELCPRLPKWPKRWPPPPPPPWQEESMKEAELFLFGTRFLAASSWAEHGPIQKALAALGEKALGFALGTDMKMK